MSPPAPADTSTGPPCPYTAAGREVLAVVDDLARLPALTAADIAALTFAHFIAPAWRTPHGDHQQE